MGTGVVIGKHLFLAGKTIFLQSVLSRSIRQL
jgi:hypothetical protein